MVKRPNHLFRIFSTLLLLGIVGGTVYRVWRARQSDIHPEFQARTIGKDEGIEPRSGKNATISPIDIRSVAPDLLIPELETVAPAPGKRVKEVVPDFADTDAYHITYLPTDWKSGKHYPVIFEYAGNGTYQNQYGDVCTGRAQDSKLGYGISAGRGFIWVCLPYLNNAGTANSNLWWGDPKQYNPIPTVDYCKKAVPLICETYGGDPDRILLVGFSRGAIACNFIGLHDEEIAKLWRGFVPYSHYDGVSDFGLPGLEPEAALERLMRLADRPQFVCAELGPGNHSVDSTRAYLNSTGVNGQFTFRTTGFRNHNDGWVLRPSPARNQLRKWVGQILN